MSRLLLVLWCFLWFNAVSIICLNETTKTKWKTQPQNQHISFIGVSLFFFIWQKIKERKFEMHLWAVYWEISLHYIRLRCSRDCNLGYKGMLPLFKVQHFFNKSFCWRILLKEIVVNLNLLNHSNLSKIGHWNWKFNKSIVIE